MGRAKASFHDLSFTHKIDKASPVLMKGCATGQHLKEATITRRKAGKGQQEFLVIKMNDVLITAVTDADSERRGQSGDREPWRLRRSISNIARKRPTGLSMPAFTSSTTSRPTRKRSPDDASCLATTAR